MNSKIRISEKFATIQGEGKFSGVPSFFIFPPDVILSCAAIAELLDVRQELSNERLLHVPIG